MKDRGERPQRKPIKGKYEEPRHWDGRSALFVPLARHDPSGPTASVKNWLKAQHKPHQVSRRAMLHE